MADAIIAPAAAFVLAVSPNDAAGSLLRFTTAGSVDDGKSTLIGRLLYDTQSAYEDQIDSVRKSRINRSSGPIDFSLLTDGLRAEREQGITIDVAYRYFSTSRRKFIIADTPGHEQYTRNMATGASTADAAIVLIDVTKGVLPQSRRHAYISHLLGIRCHIFAVNKMDAVGFDEVTFREINDQVRTLAEQIGIANAYVVPVSALEGDNVVRRSPRTPWFSGPSLLEYLESVPLTEDVEESPFRLPIQYVIRPDASFRGFAGQVASGRIAKGDVVVALPSGRRSRIRSIVGFCADLDSAEAGDSVTVTLEDEIDLSRGDLLVSESAPSTSSRHIRAKLVWMYLEPLNQSKLYVIKHTTRTARARVVRLLHRLDVATLQPTVTDSLGLNDIAEVDIDSTLPLHFDPYRQNRTMGSFILIDPLSNATVAAGMIKEPSEASIDSPSNEARTQRVSASERHRRNGHPAAAVWLDDARLAERFERELFDEGWLVQLAPVDQFSRGELLAVARVMRSVGVLTIFSASAVTHTDCRSAVEGLFARDSFFTSQGQDELSGLLAHLRNWREFNYQSTGKGTRND